MRPVGNTESTLDTATTAPHRQRGTAHAADQSVRKIPPEADEPSDAFDFVIPSAAVQLVGLDALPRKTVTSGDVV